MYIWGERERESLEDRAIPRYVRTQNRECCAVEAAAAAATCVPAICQIAEAVVVVVGT